MAKKKLPIIYFEWVDAYANGTWFTREEMNKWNSRPCWIKEAGILVSENHKTMCVAQRIDNTGVEENYGGLHQIPRTWIRKRKIIGWITIDG